MLLTPEVTLQSLQSHYTENNWKSVLFSYRVGTGDQTQVSRLGGGHFRLLSRLTSHNEQIPCDISEHSALVGPPPPTVL